MKCGTDVILSIPCDEIFFSSPIRYFSLDTLSPSGVSFWGWCVWGECAKTDGVGSPFFISLGRNGIIISHCFVRERVQRIIFKTFQFIFSSYGSIQSYFRFEFPVVKLSNDFVNRFFRFDYYIFLVEYKNNVCELKQNWCHWNLICECNFHSVKLSSFREFRRVLFYWICATESLNRHVT